MKRRNKHRDHQTVERDAPRHRYPRAPTDQRWREPELFTPSTTRIRSYDLWEPTEDLRTWHPERPRPLEQRRLHDRRMVVTTLQAPPSKSILGAFKAFDVPTRVAFNRPAGVSLCVKRHRRRQVMHALGLAGRRGLGRGRKQHRNEFSEIGC